MSSSQNKDKPTPTRRDAPRKRTAKPRRRWPLVVALCVALVVVAAASAYSWDRWLRYDDAHSLKGTWNTNNTEATVVIDGSVIKLADDVSYAYTLDTTAKTIAYSFGTMQGQGRYRFAADRQHVVIIDGTYTWFDTILQDIPWQIDQVLRWIQSQPPAEVPLSENTLLLDLVSRDTEGEPQTASDQEAAEVPSSVAGSGTAA